MINRYYGERWKAIPKSICPCTNNGSGNGVIYHPNQIYEVSNYGRVRNKHTKQLLSIRNYKGCSKVSLKGRYEMTWRDDHNWFLNESKTINFTVSRLVVATFIYGCDLKPWYSVRHLDGNSANNCLDNLDVKY